MWYCEMTNSIQCSCSQSKWEGRVVGLVVSAFSPDASALFSFSRNFSPLNMDYHTLLSGGLLVKPVEKFSLETPCSTTPNHPKLLSIEV